MSACCVAFVDSPLGSKLRSKNASVSSFDSKKTTLSIAERGSTRRTKLFHMARCVQPLLTTKTVSSNPGKASCPTLNSVGKSSTSCLSARRCKCTKIAGHSNSPCSCIQHRLHPQAAQRPPPPSLASLVSSSHAMSDEQAPEPTTTTLSDRPDCPPRRVALLEGSAPRLDVPGDRCTASAGQ